VAALYHATATITIRKIKQTAMARHSKIIGMLLAALYLSYFVGTHFFVHTHQLPTRVVVHSHPFAKLPHNHTTLELQLIDELSTYTCLVDDLQPQIGPTEVGFFLFPVPVIEAPLPSPWGPLSLRAPPSPRA